MCTQKSLKMKIKDTKISIFNLKFYLVEFFGKLFRIIQETFWVSREIIFLYFNKITKDNFTIKKIKSLHGIFNWKAFEIRHHEQLIILFK